MKNKKLRKSIIIGTRASLLAITQSGMIRDKIKQLSPGTKVILKRIVTSGDRFRDRSLAQIGGKGLFTKEIEEALLKGEIDLAVHSLKDVPTLIPQGLCLGAIPKREISLDVLLWNPLSISEQSNTSKSKSILAFLPIGAIIGTSSLRRQAQLLKYRPEFNILPLRGNLPTRIRKLEENQIDAIILARAGMNRLNIKYPHMQEIPRDIMLPAIGQGALAIECRSEDNRILTILKKLNHTITEQCVTAERSFLSALGGGCQYPIAASAEIKNKKLFLVGMIISPDGHKFIKGKISGKPKDAQNIGLILGKRLLEKGARKILTELKKQQTNSRNNEV